MPSTGYDDTTDHMGARSFTRTWKVKLAVLAVFAAAVGARARVAWLLR